MVQNSAFAVGQVWSRTGCIPIGGCFSAQAADLYSVWRLKKLVHAMRALGDLSTCDAGIPIWTTQIHGTSVRIALAQFRDNFMIASSATHAKHLVMGRVCKALSTAWKLPVLCECKKCLYGVLYEELHCSCWGGLPTPAGSGDTAGALTSLYFEQWMGTEVERSIANPGGVHTRLPPHPVRRSHAI